MSLSRFALRVCTARALRDVTLAEGRIFQSAIDPLDTRVREVRQPMLIINTDDHAQTGDGRDMTGGEDKLDLVIEATIAGKTSATGIDGQGDEVSIEVPGADAGMDLTLDILEHQVIRALVRGNGVWAALWRRMALRINSRTSRRGADVSGVRWAARQLVLSCDVLAEPIGGEHDVARGFWADFLAAMAADTDLARVEPLIRGVLIGGGTNPDWERTAAMIGVGVVDAESLGFAPVAMPEGGQPAEAAEGDFVRVVEGGDSLVWDDASHYQDADIARDDDPTTIILNVTTDDFTVTEGGAP